MINCSLTMLQRLLLPMKKEENRLFHLFFLFVGFHSINDDFLNSYSDSSWLKIYFYDDS